MLLTGYAEWRGNTKHRPDLRMKEQSEARTPQIASSIYKVTWNTCTKTLKFLPKRTIAIHKSQHFQVS